MTQTQSPVHSVDDSDSKPIFPGFRSSILDWRYRKISWDPGGKRRQTQILVLVLEALVVVVTILAIVWIVRKPMTPASVKEPPKGDIASVLMPVLAAAIGINLFLENVFSFIEGNWRTLVAYFGRGLRWLQSAQTEAENSRQWLTQVTAEYNRELESLPQFTLGDAVPDVEQLYQAAAPRIQSAQKLMILAEQRLETAEERLSHLHDSSTYLDFKRSTVVYLCLLLGLVIATASSLQIFAVMGIQLGDPKVDMVLTGLVIGGLVRPVHVLINNFWDILTKLVKK